MYIYQRAFNGEKNNNPMMTVPRKAREEWELGQIVTCSIYYLLKIHDNMPKLEFSTEQECEDIIYWFFRRTVKKEDMVGIAKEQCNNASTQLKQTALTV